MFLVVELMSGPGAVRCLPIKLRIVPEADNFFHKAVHIRCLAVKIEQNVAVQLNIPQQHGQTAVHRFQNNHGKQLIIGGQKQHIGQIIDLVHFPPVDDAGKHTVFGRVFQHPADFLIPVGHVAEGKAAGPYKLYVREPLGTFHKVKDPFAPLQLSRAHNREAVRIQPVFFSQARFAVEIQGIEILDIDKIGDVGDFFPVDAVCYQPGR